MEAELKQLADAYAPALWAPSRFARHKRAIELFTAKNPGAAAAVSGKAANTLEGTNATTVRPPPLAEQKMVSSGSGPHF